MDHFRPGDLAPKPLKPPKFESGNLRFGSSIPLVSVVCLTFNHARFIEAAVHGFLAQKADFPFEIIIRDDASTDGTRQLLERFAMEYPNKIQLLLNSSNTWRKQGFGVASAVEMARGELIAFCDGDDYWIRSDKLQRQVDLIRTRPASAAVTTGQVNIHRNKVESVSKFDGGTRTLLFWKALYPVDFLSEFASEFAYHDSFLMSILKSRGRIIHLPEYTAVWRRHEGGIHGGLDENDRTRYFGRQAETRYWISVFFRNEGSIWRSRYYSDQTIHAVRKGLRQRHFSLWSGLKLTARIYSFLRRRARN